MDNLRVLKDFTYHGNAHPSFAMVVPAGSPVEVLDGRFFVKPSVFPKDSMMRHDATYYGCIVDPKNVKND